MLHITGRRPRYNAPVHDEAADFAGDGGLGGKIHGGVAVFEIAEHADALKFLRLHRQPMLRVLAAFGAEIDQGHLILVAPGLAVLFLDPPFDRRPWQSQPGIYSAS